MTDNTPKFVTEEADRLLGLADQFLEDWAIDAVEDGQPDPDYEQCQKDWEAIRPLLAAAPVMLDALTWQEMADADPAASRRKGYFEHARRLRQVALAKARGQA